MAASFSALLASACSSVPATADPVHFDPCQPLALLADAALTPAQASGISAAIELWNGRAASRLLLARAGEVPAGVPTVPIHFQAAAAPFHGLYDDARGRVFINLDLTDHAQAIAIAHEVGHSFGLEHVDAARRTSLMNPGNLDVEPTEGDIEALAERWGGCAPPL